MDREKMIDRWEKEFEQDYYTWHLHPQIYDYFEGESTLSGQLYTSKTV